MRILIQHSNKFTILTSKHFIRKNFQSYRSTVMCSLLCKLSLSLSLSLLLSLFFLFSVSLSFSLPLSLSIALSQQSPLVHSWFYFMPFHTLEYISSVAFKSSTPITLSIITSQLSKNHPLFSIQHKEPLGKKPFGAVLCKLKEGPLKK